MVLRSNYNKHIPPIITPERQPSPPKSFILEISDDSFFIKKPIKKLKK